MKTVIIATGENPGMAALAERQPISMLTLLDQPLIQHVVESLVRQGLDRFDFLLCHMPERFEDLLGDGSRWEASFSHHLVRDAAQPFRTLKALQLAADDEPVLIGFADRLAPIDRSAVTVAPAAFCWREQDGLDPGGSPDGASSNLSTATATRQSVMRWAGWAVVTGRDIGALPDDLDAVGFEERVLSIAGERGSIIEVGRPLAVRSYDDLIESHGRALGRDFAGLSNPAIELAEGIWISRNVSIHPTARLVPPVYVGENCRIAIGSQIGPHAVVGRDSMLDARCQVTHAVITPGSYVGEALELDHVIVDRNRLINTRHGAEVIIPDSFILGSTGEDTLRRKVSRLVRRLLALSIVTLMAPLLAATFLALRTSRAGPVLFRKKVVRLPARQDSPGWSTYDLLSFLGPRGEARTWPGDFFLGFLPGLINVARGELSLVGLPARTIEEIAALPDEWRRFYLSCRAGLVSEGDVVHDGPPTSDEAFAAEVYYSVKMSPLHDCRLLAGYLSRVLPARRRRDSTRARP